MPGTYDDIARFYDVDMARNMPFDDVAFYADLCARHGGRVLELGCGSGRILLPLLQRGIDAVGVDASAGMLAELRRKAAALGLRAPVARMDVTRLALRGGFGVVLCPYSLVTYVTEDADLARLLAAVRRLLAPGGVFVVDAFVPKPVVAQQEFQPDYRRPFGDRTLARWKRILAASLCAAGWLSGPLYGQQPQGSPRPQSQAQSPWAWLTGDKAENKSKPAAKKPAATGIA